MEEALPQAQAIAIRDEKIVAVGEDASILALQTPETQIVDLKGRTLMPGFVDAHTYVLNSVAWINLLLASMLILPFRGLDGEIFRRKLGRARSFRNAD
jgi:predicted amidohydrolase YtcJ